MPSQNMPLWHKDYYYYYFLQLTSNKDYLEVEAIEKKERLLYPTLICIKAGHTSIKVSLLLSLPGRIEVNHQRQL